MPEKASEESVAKSYYEKIKSNVLENSGLILAILGDILSTIIIALLFCLRGGMQWEIFWFIILLALKPFAITLLDLTFKGKVKSKDTEIALRNQEIEFLKKKKQYQLDIIKLKQEAEFIRELAEWQVLVAAKEGSVRGVLEHSKEWHDANELIKETNGIAKATKRAQDLADKANGNNGAK